MTPMGGASSLIPTSAENENHDNKLFTIILNCSDLERVLMYYVYLDISFSKLNKSDTSLHHLWYSQTVLESRQNVNCA